MNLSGPVASKGSDWQGFLLGFDPAGALLWSKLRGAAALSFDGDAAVVMAANFQLRDDIGCGEMRAQKSYFDGFVARLDAGTGAAIWARHYGSSGGNTLIRALAVGSAGDIVLTANTTEVTDFGGGPLGPSSVLARLSREGKHIWSQSYRGCRPVTKKACATLSDCKGPAGEFSSFCGSDGQCRSLCTGENSAPWFVSPLAGPGATITTLVDAMGESPSDLDFGGGLVNLPARSVGLVRVTP